MLLIGSGESGKRWHQQVEHFFVKNQMNELSQKKTLTPIR